MSKYQKLGSEHSTYENVDDDCGDDYGFDDESYSLYFDNNRNNKNNNNHNKSVYGNGTNTGNGNCNQNENNDRLNSVVVNENYNNNNNENHNNINQTNIHDFEEHTMEVPLLRSSSSNNVHDFEHATSLYSHGAEHCRCAQAGFAVNLKCKSAQEAKFKILLAISLCCIFMIIEFLGGYIAGSLAIMTDAAHLASDCISFVIGLVAIWLGGRPPDGRMSFGYKRMEVMGAIASILGIWILTATLVMVAIQRIYSNDFDLDANTMMTISGIGILINIAMAFILHGSWFMQSNGLQGHGHGHGHSHAHGHTHATPTPPLVAVATTSPMALAPMPTHTLTILTPNGNANITPNGFKQQQHERNVSHNKPKHERNLNLRAAMIHVIGDLVQSIGVFLAAVLIKFCPSAKFADPLCTLLFSVIVIMTTVQLFKESMTILLDAVPHGLSLHELEMDLSSIEGVKSVHHLNVWSHTANHCVLMAHLVIDLLTDSNTVLDKATLLAESSKYNIKHSTIQIERLAV